MRTSEILEGIKEIAKGIGREPPGKRTIHSYIRELLEKGILESRRRGLYRPSDYFYEYSRAVPPYLMEKSENFLSVPLSPQVWMGISNFPQVKEMSLAEIPELLGGLLLVANGLQVLHGVRVRTALRLGKEQVRAGKREILEGVSSLLSRVGDMGGFEVLGQMDETDPDLAKLESDADELESKSRTVSLTEWWERYAEEPLVVSGVFLSHVQKTTAFVRRGKPEPVNFQIYSYFRRFLEFCRELWELEKACGRIPASKADEEMRELGLADDEFENTVARLCMRYVRKMVGAQLRSLKERMKRLNALRDEWKSAPETDPERQSALVGEIFSWALSDDLFGPDEEALRALYADVTTSELMRELLSFDKTLIIHARDVEAYLSKRIEYLRELELQLSTAETPEEVRLRTRGIPAPAYHGEWDWRQEDLALLRRYYPPTIRSLDRVMPTEPKD